MDYSVKVVGVEKNANADISPSLLALRVDIVRASAHTMIRGRRLVYVFILLAP